MSNNPSLGPGSHGVPEVKYKESENKSKFLANKGEPKQRSGPGPTDFFVDGRFG